MRHLMLWQTKDDKMPTSKQSFLQRSCAPALEASKLYWPAILLIQGFALAILIGYYSIEASRGAFDTVASWKQNGGFLFAAITTIISGGILPEILKRFLRPEGVPSPRVSELIHQFIMWAYLGILVDLFYRFLNHLFGSGTDALTLLYKVLFDQFLFAPLLSMPSMVAWFMLYESGFKPKRFLQQFRLKRVYERILPLWATSLIFWPVMLAIIFSLPQALQFPLFLFGNAAYSILMIFILRHQRQLVVIE
jgi:hypothetical protein